MSPEINNEQKWVGLLMFYAFNVSMILLGIYWLIIHDFFQYHHKINELTTFHWTLLVGNYLYYDLSKPYQSNDPNNIANTYTYFLFHENTYGMSHTFHTW